MLGLGFALSTHCIILGPSRRKVHRGVTGTTLQSGLDLLNGLVEWPGCRSGILTDETKLAPNWTRYENDGDMIGSRRVTPSA